MADEVATSSKNEPPISKYDPETTNGPIKEKANGCRSIHGANRQIIRNSAKIHGIDKIPPRKSPTHKPDKLIPAVVGIVPNIPMIDNPATWANATLPNISLR